MSIVATIENVSEELEDKILSEVLVKKITEKPKFSKFKVGSKPKEIIVRPYRMTTNCVYLPFHWALDNIPGLKRRERVEFTKLSENVKFVIELRNVQAEVKGECLKALNKFGSHLISLYPGSGKSILAIYLACKIGLKTLIICHRVELLKQWIEEIDLATGSGATCSIINPLPKDNEKKKKPKTHNLDVDFLLVNPSNVPKLGDKLFKDVGLIIIDEIHRVMAETLAQCLYYVSPRYIIGLSATLYRPDGLDGLLDFYFGVGNRTVRELYHPHIVYKIQTNIEFEEDSSTQWGALITSQCDNQVRNDLIVEIISKFEERYFMVLCQRVNQAKYIYNKLIERGEISSLYTGQTSGYDKKSRIIVSTLSKGGEGFSYKILDSLIIASDCISSETEEYMIQYLSRVFRTENVSPLVFDIVDNHHTLKKHFAIRKRVYIKAGGTVKDFYKENPIFEQSRL